MDDLIGLQKLREDAADGFVDCHGAQAAADDHDDRLAKNLIKILKPDVIFSKGGFVSVPVVAAGRRRHVPTIIHESDMTPGLANKLSFPSATKICCNFPETLSLLPDGKAVLTGSPIRQELLSGDKYKARDLLNFQDA